MIKVGFNFTFGFEHNIVQRKYGIINNAETSEKQNL